MREFELRVERLTTSDYNRWMYKLSVGGPARKIFFLLMMWFTRHLIAAEDYGVPLEPFDYSKPPVLTGTIYAIGSNHTNVLFTFRRSATRSGDRVRVDRLFDFPDGRVAAVEHVLYESGLLVSYEMNDVQAGLWGTIEIVADPHNAGRQKLIMNHGRGAVVKGKGVERNLPKDMLIDDAIYPFILTHWDELMRGKALQFCMASLERNRTFAFVVRKGTESMVAGGPVVWLKMTPASRIVARFVNPIAFCIEKNPPHRILEYIGRTTLRVKEGDSWKILDADTVFDWQ